MRLAVIPARAGSKRIAHKNTRDFHGKPMLAYSIATALAAESIHRVWVSTDDRRIADLARSLGAEVPFLRPASLADDHTGLNAVMQHAMAQAAADGHALTHACLLFATAPLMDAADIDRGFDTLSATRADMALSVTPFRSAPQRAQRLNAEGCLEYCHPEYRQIRTQDLEPRYHDAAQFVWGTRLAFSAPPDAVRTVPVIVESWRVVDIDEPGDWQRAEIVYQLMQSSTRRAVA